MLSVRVLIEPVKPLSEGMKEPMVAMVVSVCCSGRAHRSLDGDPWPGERSARSPLARSVSGGRREPAFLTSREECRAFAAGEKSRRSRCGKAIEAFWPPLGPDQPFEVALDASPERTDGDNHGCRCHHSTRTRPDRSNTC